jgi:hypothetical protein
MRAPQGSATTIAFAAVDSDEFKLNLSDIPRLPMSLDVEGLKPSLLSRVVDLFSAKR